MLRKRQPERNGCLPEVSNNAQEFILNTAEAENGQLKIEFSNQAPKGWLSPTTRALQAKLTRPLAWRLVSLSLGVDSLVQGMAYLSK